MPLVPGFWLLLLCFLLPDKQLSLQITPPCDSGQHYEYSGRCCTKCEPGKYMVAKCTATSETICQPCGSSEYMDVWNEEDKCFLHKICDRGKGLIEVNPGNSTFQRMCACTSEYHWNEDCDCCQRNRKCAPGYGVQPPLQQNKDTVCKRCLAGYFSDVSSSTETCKSWTNCTALGTAEKIRGTDRLDAVCEEPLISVPPRDDTKKLLYGLIVPFLLVVLIAGIVALVYCQNKGKALTVGLQHWANEICRRIKGTKDSCRDTFVNPNMANASPHSFRKMYLLSLDEDAFCEELHRSNRHDLCMKCGPDTIRYESEEDVPTLSLIAESEGDHFRQTPMEDEYVDRTPYGYLPLLSRSDSKPVSPFSEPVEVGEDDSLSHCFTGMESLEDLTCCCGADSSYGVDCVHASPGKCLQKSCHCDYSNMKEVESQDVNCSLLNPEGMSRCTGCGVPCRESPRKWNELLGAAAENPTVPFEAGTAARCTCGSDSPSVDESASTSDASTGDASSDGNDAKYQNTNRSASGANCNTSDLPPASGNVTGNSNSTFISNGQVMNFKGDIIVVYLSQNSQEGSAATGAADDNVGSPVQEENLNRCETFAGNVHQYKEKCAEVHSDCSELNSTEEYERTPGPVVQTESHNGLKPLCNGTSQPVQEEGKPGHFSKKALH